MRCRTALLMLAAFWMTGAEARVTRLEITAREPFAAGQAFGDVGSYERVVGRFHGELDSGNPLNAGIVDLDKAPRNARGMVEYSSDFFILRPAEMAKGNGTLLYDVNNRGNKRALIQFNSAPASNDPRTPAEAGNGFLMREGFTVVWSGWIPGLAAANNALRIDIPSAPGLEQTVWDEFLFNDRTTMQARLSFPAVSMDRGQAQLVTRARNGDAPVPVSAENWEFVDAHTIRLLPAGTPFSIGVIYQLSYRAANPPVGGIGFAATRDLVSFLRHQAAADDGTPNPLAAAGRPGVVRAIAHGTSQSGRYLRDFVYRGFNEDESNRIVFEGINPHIATGRLFLNFRFGQANRMMNIGYGFVAFPDGTFPWAYETQTDPLTGKSDGILARCTVRNNCPKVIHTNSAIEYWQSAQSLVTTDPLGKQDGTPPASVRIYHLAGTQHILGATMPKGVCALPPNPTDYSPVMRDLILALDRWVRDGSEPPPSRYPRIDDGTLVDAAGIRMPVPNMTMAPSPAPRVRYDYGPHYAEGVIDKVLPVATGETYRVLVPKVDADGNEVAGIRLPDIAVPTATVTGWAVRSKDAGGAGELCYLDGSYAPFAHTKAERAASGDPRLSIEERYRDRSDYAAQVNAAAAALARGGYLLQEDVDRITARARSITW